jgi:hypothetical protein
LGQQKHWAELAESDLRKLTNSYFLTDACLKTMLRRTWELRSVNSGSPFMQLREAQRHLYEIHTAPQSDPVSAILSGDQVVELAPLRDFLGR